VLDFERDIQPILDSHCVECHNPDRYEGRIDLGGDKTPTFSISYWTLRRHDLVSDGRNASSGNRAPRSIGSSASPLMTYLDGAHYRAKLSDHDRKVIRLWIETGATYAGTYGALNTGIYPVALPEDAIKQRCGNCHGKLLDDKRGRRYEPLYLGDIRHMEELVCNISQPEKSLVLQAPLAREAGGLGLCRQAVFAGADDPLYREILARLRDSHNRLKNRGRFGMPGFRPHPRYIRQMQQFGILPEDVDPKSPIDVYAVDRAYWDSMKYADGVHTCD